jgi:hypothetical protein
MSSFTGDLIMDLNQWLRKMGKKSHTSAQKVNGIGVALEVEFLTNWDGDRRYTLHVFFKGKTRKETLPLLYGSHLWFYARDLRIQGIQKVERSRIQDGTSMITVILETSDRWFGEPVPYRTTFFF